MPQGHVAALTPRGGQAAARGACPAAGAGGGSCVEGWGPVLQAFDSLMAMRPTGSLGSIAEAVMWSWAPSTLTTYRSRLAAVVDRERGMPAGTSRGLVVQTVLLEALATGRPAASLRAVLSAVQCAHTLGLVDFVAPAVWWRLSPAAHRLALAPARPRTWFAVDRLARLAGGELSDS